MEYGIWSLHVAGELWGDPRQPRRHPFRSEQAAQISSRAALALSALPRPTEMPVPLTFPRPLPGASYAPGADLDAAQEPVELVARHNVPSEDEDSEGEVETEGNQRDDDREGNRKVEGDREQSDTEIESTNDECRRSRAKIIDGYLDKQEENDNQMAIETNDDRSGGNESDTGSTNSSRRSINSCFSTKLPDPISCLALDKIGAVTSPVLDGWVLGAYTAMLGRLSAATAALEATDTRTVPSESESESEHSSNADRSRAASPVERNLQRGYSCSSCDVIVSTRSALRKHVAACHPVLSVVAAAAAAAAAAVAAASSATTTNPSPGDTRLSGKCPTSGCDFATNSRCEMETHVESHVAQGITSTGKKRSLALQRVRYEREEYRCSLCSYACTIEKAFQRHLRAHARGTAPETRVSCAVCGADRSSEVDLSRHMRRHRDDRYFCCDICIFRTVQLKKLIQHRRMHTGEKPHLCPHCTYRSARRDNLRSHVRRVHKKENLYCDTFSPRGMLITPSMHSRDVSPVRSPTRSPSPSTSPPNSPLPSRSPSISKIDSERDSTN